MEDIVRELLDKIDELQHKNIDLIREHTKILNHLNLERSKLININMYLINSGFKDTSLECLHTFQTNEKIIECLEKILKDDWSD